MRTTAPKRCGQRENVFMQTEAPLIVSPTSADYHSELFALMASGMAHIARHDVVYINSGRTRSQC